MPEAILRLHGPASLATYQDRLLPSHRRASQDLCACRTAALAGQLYRCPPCEQEHSQDHSCQNRHCPNGQHEQVEGWLEQQRALLVPAPYFRATFTLPAGLRRLARSHQQVVYALLFRASQQALQTLAADPKYVGGTLGLLGALHSWARDLRSHPHVHSLIPGGGLSPDGSLWRPVRSNYLLPARPLAQLLRAKFRDLLKQAGLIDQVPAKSWHQDWVVDILAVGSGAAAWKSLAPYVFRVAISNRNLLAFTDGQLTFRYRDSQTQLPQTTALPAEPFIGRFLQHVLPRGFQKVRAYGLLHPKQRPRFRGVQAHLQPDRPGAVHPPPAAAPSTPPSAGRPVPPRCPHCACQLIHVRPIHRRRGPP